MMDGRWRDKFQALLRREAQHLATINPSDRRWQMPFCAALGAGPLSIDARRSTGAP